MTGYDNLTPRMPGEAPEQEPRIDAVIGQSVLKIDGPAKVSGAAVYTDDLKRPRMLHGALLGSPYPHARILGYNTSAARALPGVKAVLTAEDLPVQNIGAAVCDEPILARGKTRYVGEPIAAVAAVSVAIARAAVQLIEIEYEELPAVFDAEEAMALGAPIIHEDAGSYARATEAPFADNMVAHMELETGDVDKVWAECDHIIEGEYAIPAIHAQYMETCGALAELDNSGKLIVWCSTQSIFLTQLSIASALQIPMSKVRCITPAVGGGFGAKFGSVEPITAALTLATRRPVKLVLSRDEDMSMMRTRHAAKIRMKTGARADGTLLCRDIDIILNGGAYADLSPLVLECSILLAHGPYRIPNVRTVGRVAYTNRLRAGAFRGFGVMQPTFAGESQLDELAAKLQIDPIDFRIRNAMQSGDYNMGSHHIPSCHLAECLESIQSHPDFIAASAERVGPTGRKRGVGISSVTQQSGLFSSSAAVRVAEDGTLVLNTGYIDIGTGSDTSLAQICAGTLGLGVEHVNVVAPDTDGVAYDFGTASDRASRGVSESVYRASLAVKQKLFEFASVMLQCPPDRLELRPGGRVGIIEAPEAELPFSAIVQWGLYAGNGPIIGTHAYYMQEQKINHVQTRSVGFRMGGGVWYGYGATAVQVEVNEDTGQVEVIAAWHAHDVGRVINPDGARGQVYGGVAQGISGALYEELVWDNGHLTNPSLMDYKIVGAPEVPHRIHAILLENRLPDSPYGAKGFAEPTIIGVAPAIANAVANAVGARVRTLPITAERVLNTLSVS
ncbi:xanthine dehydrogenase family protein molybdopterin-binding subunit [Novosphingobium naphthalenivorans]|uniref:xanthine dehydrogenase family protein molybdopterin-binding subunit n=1 Tax=Novosphingobium naphthalenivorans TaxID=273168 RepID=UPI0009FEDB1D|nr:xanthine dehydrogenase family protein molybdopterin-binding subunit [Novosphingobium naphthalenivorans]